MNCWPVVINLGDTEVCFWVCINDIEEARDMSDCLVDAIQKQ